MLGPNAQFFRGGVAAGPSTLRTALPLAALTLPRLLISTDLVTMHLTACSACTQHATLVILPLVMVRHND